MLIPKFTNLLQETSRNTTLEDTPLVENPVVSQDPQPPGSNEFMETEPEAIQREHTLNKNGPVLTPVILPEDNGRPIRARPVKQRLIQRESERIPAQGIKRAHCPSKAITPRHNTRWSSLSEEEKRRKKI